ncbi:MAG: hypothetical protein LBR88_00360, partial [Zoogloeaceae bacterium]|nr:hypothetical protein [Zoogloeaceae bacterium]
MRQLRHAALPCAASCARVVCTKVKNVKKLDKMIFYPKFSASKQASKQASTQASKQARTHASKQSTKEKKK